jgi:hypothetical protein
MFFVLIAIAWIAVVTLLVVLCRMAAGADVTPAPAADASPRSEGRGLFLWEAPSTPKAVTDWTLHDITRRRQAEPPLRRARPAPRKRRIGAHGIHDSSRS